MKLSQRSIWVHWVAIFAILMSLLVPAISQAIISDESLTRIDSEICSALGTKISHHIQIDSSKGSDRSSDEHCPYCALQHLSYMPATVQVHAVTIDHPTTFSSLHDQSPRSLITWLKQPSQAPPHISKLV